MADVKLESAAAFIVKGHRERVARAIRAVQDMVQTRGPVAIQEAIGETAPLPVDRGTFMRGWKFVRIEKGAEVFPTTPYASVIEGGRRPGGKMPPTGPLAEWVRRKGIVKGRGKSAEANAKSIAFAVAKAIQKRGTPGRWILRRAMLRLNLEVRQAIKRSMEEGTPE